MPTPTAEKPAKLDMNQTKIAWTIAYLAEELGADRMTPCGDKFFFNSSDPKSPPVAVILADGTLEYDGSRLFNERPEDNYSHDLKRYYQFFGWAQCHSINTVETFWSKT
jgi:hypothetical protein